MAELAIAKGPRAVTPVNGSPAADLRGLDKAALVLLSIDRGKAIELLRSFDPAEAKALLAAADRLRSVGANEVDAAAREFEASFMSGVSFVGSATEVRQLVADAVGNEQQVAEVPNPPASEGSVWQKLSALSSEALRDCIAEMPTQAAAFVLSQLDPARVAELLRTMPSVDRNGMVERMLSLGEVSPEVLAVIENMLRRQLTVAASKPPSPYAKIAGILNQLDMAHSREAVEHLALISPEHAVAIRKLLFKFEQLPGLPKADLAAVVDRIPVERIIIALQGTTLEFQNAVLAVMAPRTRRLAEAELQGRAAASARDIDIARRAIADAVLELVAAGRVNLEDVKAEPSGEDDGQSRG